MRNLTLALASAAVLLAPAAAHAQSNGLSSIFNCNSPNNRQGTGAVVGGLLGGVIGNQAAGDSSQTVGTVLGAALGAAAGSYIGCQMSSADVDQAQVATLNALNQNRATTWANGRTGVSGRVDIVDSFNRADASGRLNDPYYDNRDNRDDRNGRGRGYDQGRMSLDDMNFARYVQRPANFERIDDRYTARNRMNLRAGPSTRSRIVGQLNSGQAFDAVARVDGSNWLLASRNGTAIGYVSENLVRYAGRNEANDRYADQYRNRDRDLNQGRQQVSVLCRVFDQTVQTRDNSGYTSRPTTQRFTACQNERNEWVIQA